MSRHIYTDSVWQVEASTTQQLRDAVYEEMQRNGQR